MSGEDIIDRIKMRILDALGSSRDGAFPMAVLLTKCRLTAMETKIFKVALHELKEEGLVLEDDTSLSLTEKGQASR